jgi:hypothetical protein
MSLRSIILVVVCTALSCCGKDKPLFKVIEATDTECKAGGYVFLAGIDEDGNGVLGSLEVTASHLVCNGEDAEPTIGTIERSIYCTSVFDTMPDAPWAYHAIVFSSGAVWSQASVRTMRHTATGSNFEPPSVTRWSVSSASVGIDTLGDPHAGTWYDVEVTYNDLDLPPNKEVDVFVGTCVEDRFE